MIFALMICVSLMENNKKDVIDMAESKYHFERLTPIDDMNLANYFIDECLNNCEDEFNI